MYSGEKEPKELDKSVDLSHAIFIDKEELLKENIQVFIAAQNVENQPAVARFFFIPKFGWMLASNNDLLAKDSLATNNIYLSTKITSILPQNFFPISNPAIDAKALLGEPVSHDLGSLHIREEGLFVKQATEFPLSVKVAQFDSRTTQGFATASARGEKGGHYGINYDAAGAIKNGGFIADGVGRKEGAFMAKLIFKHYALLALKDLHDRIDKGEKPDIFSIFSSCFKNSNMVIQNISQKIGEKASTTGVLAFIEKQKDGTDMLHIMSSGDSRAWVVDLHGMTWVTPEQGMLAEDLKDKKISPEEYRVIRKAIDIMIDPQTLDSKAQNYYNNRNKLYHSVGSNMQISYYNKELKKGDTVLLSTDGLHGNLTMSQISKTLLRKYPSPILATYITEKALSASTDPSNLRGNPDDVSAVVLRV
ncbi:MAG TPA: hypothetical protein VLF89_05035 [Candidatus Saccharimonadales bacterium]|nr:hypothetical protein [Candidatus Saccharimonadales bacterium]